MKSAFIYRIIVFATVLTFFILRIGIPGSAGADAAEGASSFGGYNLYSSLNSTTVYLMDNNATTVHSWDSSYRPGNAIYLLENGSLLRTGNIGNTVFDAGGAGGVVETMDWDGSVTWHYEYSESTHLQHHDIEMLPNGNVLMIAWQYKTEAEALAAGRNPGLLTDGVIWPDSVIEVQPTGPTTGRIVWEWHAWDHLVQEYDGEKSNYAVVADHPELIDLNHVMNGSADWTHINAIDYNAELDQIVLSIHNFSEIWVIDHSTTALEASGHTGGNSGMGGDLLYRWGNPQTYGAGSDADRKLFTLHDAEWIEAGLPGEGNIIIFNNGGGRPGGNYSSIDEIIPPVNPDGSYSLAPGSAFGPDQTSWCYTAKTPTDFYARNISGQQRFPNGNTLICDGPDSFFFEVTSEGETIWEFDAAGAVFRVDRYASEYPGFDGTPLDEDQVNQAPTADAGGPYAGSIGRAIPLSGTGSTDTDGSIASYEWDLDNNGLYNDATAATAAFTAVEDGVFTVALKVTDNDGITDTDRSTITVSDAASSGFFSYPIVDTGQTGCYDNTVSINPPADGASFFGQDAQYDGNQPSYSTSQDGLTVYDNITRLYWTKSPDLEDDGDIDAGDKLSFSDAKAYPAILNTQSFGGYSDWRLPTMKELYSLMNFTGTDPMGNNSSGLIPFVDTTYFDFAYGDTAAGERVIDSQFWSANAYVDTVFGNQSAAFGLNLADGRIKGYPTVGPVVKTNFVYFVRGNTSYGINSFTDNGDGTVTDHATGLMWSRDDSGLGMIWEDALAWARQKNQENYLGHNDWRLPNAKEIQSIIDYSRAPGTSGSAAIDPVFNITGITNEGGQPDYPWFWTGTTHVRSDGSGSSAAYLCFGRAMGYMNGSWMDVHGAGAQRSDRKDGDFISFTYVSDGYYFSQSPQGDATRMYNYIRLVRDVPASSGDDCPDCSGADVVLENIIFPENCDCICSASVTLTAGTGVTIKSGATVVFTAPAIRFTSGVTIEERASFSTQISSSNDSVLE